MAVLTRSMARPRKRQKSRSSGVQRHNHAARRPNVAYKPAPSRSIKLPPASTFVPRGDPGTTTHLTELVDARTGNAPTSDSIVVALYNYPLNLYGEPDDRRWIDRDLLRNLTTVCEPAMLCRLVLSDRVYPPAYGDGYMLFITFNNLYLAPTIRLECLFTEALGKKEYLKLIIEWHFRALSSTGSNIEDFSWVDYAGGSQGRISFTARNATSSGFGLIEDHEHMFGRSQRDICGILKQFRQTTDAHKVEFIVESPRNGFKILDAVRCRLPGGRGATLPSFNVAEYSCFGPSPTEVSMEHLEIRKIGALMQEYPAFPMTVMPCEDTFTTAKEHQVQCLMSTSLQHEEEKQCLQAWSSAPHGCSLFNPGPLSQPVMAVKFSYFPTLSSRLDRGKYCLPNGMHTSIIFTLDKRRYEVFGFLVPDVPGLPASDAFFIITSHDTSAFKSWCNHPANSDPLNFQAVFRPRCPSFTRNSQMATVYQASQPENARWMRALLNQEPHLLENVDLTVSNIDARAKLHADEWLWNYARWNPEQKEAIRAIKAARGGIVLIHGPAGTGKTLLQKALSIYFYKLGFHILALAPANSNADHLTKELARDECTAGLNFHRCYPASRDRGPDKLADDRAPSMASHEALFQVQHILDYVDQHENGKTNARDCGLEQAVVDEASKSCDRLSLFRDLDETCGDHEEIKNDNELGECKTFDVWQVLHVCLQDIRRRALSTDGRKKFVWTYGHCKAHLVRRSRYIITTTGNVRCPVLMQNFGRDENGGLDACKGIIVFVDEACKDVEQNVLAGIVCEAWCTKVRGTIMLGDERQMKPTNKSAQGLIEFNPYNKRLEISLPMRLIRQGFPSIELREQMRMSACIADFPNRKFYNGRLFNGPGTDNALEDMMPGLEERLINLIQTSSSDFYRSGNRSPDRETLVRTMWVQVHGYVERNQMLSKRVTEHADVFFEKIYPTLLGYFGNEMEQNVMVICAYSYALSYWQSRANAIARRWNMAASLLPKIVLLDSAQGQESFMVVFDGSMQGPKGLRFMEDFGRVNVALTRAKGIRWIIGGDLTRSDTWRPELPALIELKQEMDADGLVRCFN